MLQLRIEEVKDHFQILLSALHMVVESSQKFLTEEHGIQNIWVPLLFGNRPRNLGQWGG